MKRIRRPWLLVLFAAFAVAATAVADLRPRAANAEEPIKSRENRGASQDAEEIAPPKTPAGAAVAGLSARLTNAAVGQDNSIELDFVLQNHSDANIVLAERWNSWGAYQWEFRVVDAKGAEFVLRNPQTGWYANAFTTFTIPPSKTQVTRRRLDRASWKFRDEKIEIFTEVQGGIGADKRRQNSWAFPLSVTGTFSAPKENLAAGREMGEGSNWAGTITTNTVQVEKTSRPESSDDRKAAAPPKEAGGGEPVKQPQSEPSSSRAPPQDQERGVQQTAGNSAEAEVERLVVTLADAELPCGVGRVQKNGVWNEPYRYVFRDFPDYLTNARHIFMRQNGGGATGRWLETGQVEVSRPCWFFAAVHRPSDAQREIWRKEGWEILPDVLVDLGDPRFLPREVRTYMLMRKRIEAGRVNFDTRAEKTPMVIWMFQELERPDSESSAKPAAKAESSRNQSCGKST